MELVLEQSQQGSSHEVSVSTEGDEELKRIFFTSLKSSFLLCVHGCGNDNSIKYLRELWYTTEVESATNTITFTLSNSDKPLSFNLDVFSSIIGLNYTENFGLYLKRKCDMEGFYAIYCQMSGREVNVDTTADNSLSRNIMHHGAQPKAKTKKKLKKKRSPHSSKLNTFKIVKESSPKEQVADTQPAEETAATDDTTMSLDASESTYEQGKQIKPTDAEKEMRESGIKSIGDVPLNEFRGVNANLDVDESPFDTELEIKFTGKEEELIKTDEAIADNILDELANMANSKNENVNAFTNKPSQSDLFVHLHKDLSYLTSRLDKNDVNFDDLVDLVKDLVVLIDSVSTSTKNAPEGEKKMKKQRLILKGSNHPNKLLQYQYSGGSFFKRKKGSEEKPIEDEPPFKKLRILVPNPNIPSPTPLKLFNTTSSELSLTPPKDDKGIQWVKTQAAKLGIPLPPQLTTFKLPLAERKVGMKRKRRYELIHEVFVKESIIVDGMQRNLTLPKGVVGKAGMVIKEPKARIFLYNGDYDLVFQRRTGSESRPPMLNKENYVPWSSRLLRYAKSRPNGKLIYNSILNGPYVRRMIAEPGDGERDVNVNETFHEQTDDELFERELKQIEADDQDI
nr:hypothetical protein [Tanacetum cinerariifolium]